MTRLISEEPLLKAHPGIFAPLPGAVLTAFQIAEVIHPAVGLHLKGVQQIGRVPELPPHLPSRQAARLQPVPYI